MGSAALASKGLRQSPPQTSAPASLLPVIRGPSPTQHSSSRVSPPILATELGTRPPLAALLRPHALLGTGRGRASAGKLAACILGLLKTRAFARCVSSSTEKINVSEMLGFLTPVLKPLHRRVLFLNFKKGGPLGSGVECYTEGPSRWLCQPPTGAKGTECHVPSASCRESV